MTHCERSEHSPLPWTISKMENWNLHSPFVNKESPCLGEIYNKADADLIVQSVNRSLLWEEMLYELKEILEWAKIENAPLRDLEIEYISSIICRAEEMK